MNLYLISQDSNSDYDTFDSAVVCAESEDDARNMDPGGMKAEPVEWGSTYNQWCLTPDLVTVKLIGTAAPGMERGVVCASFNAG